MLTIPVAATLIALLASSMADAEIQSYQIRRLILYASNCALGALKPSDHDGSGLAFHGECSNVSEYPDGIVVLCPIVDDERACRIETPPKDFDKLKLLQPDAH